MYNSFLGLTILNSLSMHSKIATIISSSSLGGGLSSGCVHGWMIPFMSRYRLSNSIPLGFGSEESVYTSWPSTSTGWKPKCFVNKYIVEYIFALFSLESVKVLGNIMELYVFDMACLTKPNHKQIRQSIKIQINFLFPSRFPVRALESDLNFWYLNLYTFHRIYHTLMRAGQKDWNNVWNFIKSYKNLWICNITVKL